LIFYKTLHGITLRQTSQMSGSICTDRKFCVGKTERRDYLSDIRIVCRALKRNRETYGVETWTL